MPNNKEEMLEVQGVGEKKFEDYGERFLQVIREYKEKSNGRVCELNKDEHSSNKQSIDVKIDQLQTDIIDEIKDNDYLDKREKVILPTESLFKEDLSKEQLIANWIDNHFYKIHPQIEKFIRTDDLSSQHRGIDYKIISPHLLGTKHEVSIDEKAAIKYMHTPISTKRLSTFAFEIAYLHNDEFREGWLFGDKYSETEYYSLYWLNVDLPLLPKGFADSSQLAYDKINDIEVIIVEKQAIQEYLRKYNISSTNYIKVYEKMKKHHANTHETIINIKNDKDLRVQISPYLNESPVNIIISKRKLRELSVYSTVVKKK